MNSRFLETAITMDKLSPREGELLLFVQKSRGEKEDTTVRCGDLAVQFGLMQRDMVDAVVREQMRLSAMPLDSSEPDLGSYTLIDLTDDAAGLREEVTSLEHSFGVSLADEDWREFIAEAFELGKANKPMRNIITWVEKRLRRRSLEEQADSEEPRKLMNRERLRATVPHCLVWVCGAVVIGAALAGSLLPAVCATLGCIVSVAYLGWQRR